MSNGKFKKVVIVSVSQNKTSIMLNIKHFRI